MTTHRIAVRFSAFLLVTAAATAALAEQPGRASQAPSPDCGYACVFAQSTEPAPTAGGPDPVRGQGSEKTAAAWPLPRPEIIPASAQALNRKDRP
jgi:hypothetical protein